MLARRVFASALGSPSPSQQAIRTASNWASPSRTPSPCPSNNAKPQPSSTTTSASNTKGRLRPARPAVQARPRLTRPALPNTFFSTPSTLSADISKLISTIASSDPSRKTAGRRRRCSSVSPASADKPRIGGVSFSQCQIPKPADYSFTPIPIYPQPLHLHMAFTPAHQPIMANMGTGRYLQPPSKRSIRHLAETADRPFDLPTAPSPLRRLQRGPITRDTSSSGLPIISSTSTSLADHLAVTSALAHPAHHHHLASPPTIGYTSEDPEAALLRMMAEADVKHQLSAEWAFDAAMAKLGDKKAIATAAIKEGEVQQASGLEEEKAQMAQALEGLDGVLARLALDSGEVRGRSKENSPMGMGKGVTVEVKVIKIGADGNSEEVGLEDLGLGEELGVMLDSVKRKRKKKISKHKYQKRRKATRAQRKRLGK